MLYCTTDNLGNEEILKCSLDDGNCQVLFPTSQLGVNIAIGNIYKSVLPLQQINKCVT